MSEAPAITLIPSNLRHRLVADRRTDQGCRAGLRLLVAGDDEDEYDALARSAEPAPDRLIRETDVIAINYTSGTTGQPKGVMYEHRGAYLQGLAQTGHAGLSVGSVFLWTLPMFHCNGWGYTWAVTAVGGQHVCLDRIDADKIWTLLQERAITHFNCAPTVLSMVVEAQSARALPDGREVNVLTGGAPPTPTLLERARSLGLKVGHLYGLTETMGPSIACDWRPEWDAQPPAERARLLSRQGAQTMVIEGLQARDANGVDVPWDGVTLGEIALRGNTVMRGYFKDPKATAAAVVDGWFLTDLAVRHQDGYVELKDRRKDVIISGGENVASVEVEAAIASHSGVLEAAVVAAPSEKWGEVPVAFVTLRPGTEVTEAEIIAHVRSQLAGFKAPKRVHFGELPKTATGKIQKFSLREAARTQA